MTNIGKEKSTMITEDAKQQIVEVWDGYVGANASGFDNEGVLVNNIDDNRLYAIEVVKIIIHNFMKGDFNIHDFKTSLDSYNKHNNLWGFTAKLGQMYFNQIIQANEQNLEKLTSLLKDAISEPRNLRDALSKIESLEKLTTSIYNKSKDKHNAPYPGAVGYFLSYFWQIHDHQKWPILYGSLVNAYNELGIWEEHKTQKETYEYYYNLTNEIRETLKEARGKDVSNWDIEHAYWNYKNRPKPTPVPVNIPAKAEVQYSAVNEIKETLLREVAANQQQQPVEALDVREYVIPRLARLTEVSADAAGQSVPYEDLVVESFRQMDFDVQVLEQGRRKNPLALAKFREENIAFIIDARASSKDYFDQNDERLVKEYVKDQYAALKREGYKKIGFIVISHSFEADSREFVDFIAWNTELQKVTLITSEALLYMVAYKNKHRYPLLSVIDKIAGFSDLVSAANISAELQR